MLVDHKAKFLGQVTEAEENIDRVCGGVECQRRSEVDTELRGTAFEERHDDRKILTSKTTEDDNEERIA